MRRACRLVGRNIRAILHRLGDALELFEEQKIYLRHPGRERPQLHVRGRRGPGRPAGRAAARPADPPAAGRPGAGPDLGTVVRQARGGRRARAALVGGEARRTAGRAGASATAPTSTTSRRSKRPRSAARRHQVDRPRVVRAQGQSASGDPAHASRPQGLGFECVSLAEIEHVFEAVPGHRSPSASCSRRTSRRARNTSARWRWACTSRSTTCSCCSTGSMPSRARACSCASTPASAAAITTTCARPARNRSSACRFEELDEVARLAKAGGVDDHRPARARRQRRVRRRQLDAGGLGARRPREALPGREVHRRRRRSRRAGSRRRPRARSRAARRGAREGARRDPGRRRCGSSRAATSWRMPACCWRG